MYQLRISQIIQQPGDTVTFELEPLDAAYPSYKAGQFLSLVFHVNGQEIRRSYSFNSSPDVPEPLSITVKRLDNGEISRFLHHKTAVGDILTGLEPQGIFTYNPDELMERTVFLFAAGVGITPLFSILKTALSREKNSKIILVYSNHSPETSLFLDVLKEWEVRYPNRLKIIWIFSKSKNLLTARLNTLYIQQLVNEQLQTEKQKALFYCCGPGIYMDLCRITLLGMGFHSKQVKRETFVLPENDTDEDDNAPEKIKDTNTYSVVLKFKGANYSLDIPYPKRILDVALEHAIPLPYSCRSGMCSSCVATCTKGSVRMDYNEVLMDDELEKGRVLVCTAHPLTNGTTIEW